MRLKIRKDTIPPAAKTTSNGVVAGKTSYLVDQYRLSGRSGAQIRAEATAAKRLQRDAIEGKMRLKASRVKTLTQHENDAIERVM